MKLCLCGCGHTTNGNWISGHDKRATDAILEFVTGHRTITEVAEHNRQLVKAAMAARGKYVEIEREETHVNV